MKKAALTVLSLLIAFSGICSFEIANPVVAEAATVTISCSSKVSKGGTNTINVKGKKKTTYYIKIKCPKGSWSKSKTVTGSNKHKRTNSLW